MSEEPLSGVLAQDFKLSLGSSVWGLGRSGLGCQGVGLGGGRRRGCSEIPPLRVGISRVKLPRF